MIKANELRINNWVMLAGTYWQIGFAEEIDVHHFEPIELSPEILEKCKGFEFDGDEYIYEYKNIDADIRFTLKDGVLTPNPYYTGQPFTKEAHPKYLHQLQNIIFFLTGTELEISLNQ